MLNSKLKLLPLAAALALGVAGQAQAGAYAIAYDNIFDYKVLAGYTDATTGMFVVDPAGAGFTFSTTVSTSSSNASLNAASASDIKFGTLPDALPSQIGVAKANNDMTAVGAVGNYARGDAQVISEQTATVPPVFAQAWNIAEANVDSNGTFGSGQGDNLSATVMTIVFNLAKPAQILFEGSADPFMEVILGATSQAGSFAFSELTGNVNIKQGALNVFNWSPDGVAGGITGGVELLDTFTLNTTLTQLIPGSQLYDPTTCGQAVCADGTVVDVGDSTPDTPVGITHRAISGVLAAGTYTLNLAMREKVQVYHIPEPGTLGLLGLGLLGLGAIARRKRV